MTLEAIANEINDMDEKIILIYAFNGTGKTRLSVAYKDATKDANNGQHAGVYYNAFSEDLFVWDNDEDNDGTDIKLNVLHSPLNQFHSFIFEDEALEGIKNKLAPYNPKYDFKFNIHADTERGIESVTFFVDLDEETPIKISRGEERIFVWCFYLTLLEADGWADEQDAHIFIDDPVSSLDEHNIFITADTIFDQFETHSENKKIILTTHHVGLFSILSNRLGRNSALRNIHARKYLKHDGNDLSLTNVGKNALPYHLHIINFLKEAQQPNNQLFIYHGALLRQLIESISAFLGDGTIRFVLEKLNLDDVQSAVTAIHSMTHQDSYYPQSEFMPEGSEEKFRDVFQKLLNKYEFRP